MNISRTYLWVCAPDLQLYINYGNNIGSIPSTTDPSALWAPPLTSGRILGYIPSFVMFNWKLERGD